ncbi:MAG: AsmA-like C-terminal domain-containing protein [Nitrospiraceae bacterium]
MQPNRRLFSVIPRWFLVLAFSILLGPALQALLNLAPVRGAIADHLANETGLEVGDLHIRLVPRPRVQLLDVVMRDPTLREPVLRAERLEAAMAVRPLLRKKFELARLLLVNPRVTLRRDAEGRWRLPFESTAGGVPERHGLQEETLSHLPLTVECLGGEVELIVERSGQDPESLRLTDIRFVTTTDALRRETDLQLTGHVLRGEQASTVTLGGTLTGLDRPAETRPAEVIARAAHPSFSGRIDVQDLATREWTRWFGGDAAREGFEGLTDMTVRVNVAPGPAGYDLTLSQFELRLDWLALNGEGDIHGIGTDHPTYTATLSSSPFWLGTFFRNVPALLADPELRAMLYRQEGDGMVEVVRATVNGRLGESQMDEWKGILKLSQGRILMGKDRVPIQDLSGKVVFDPHTVQFVGLKGAYGPIRISDGTMTLSHVQVAPSLDLDVAGDVQASELLQLMRETGDADVQRLLRGMIDEAAGTVRLSVRLAGELTPEPKVMLVKAEISGQDLEVRTPRLSRPIERLSADVMLTPRAVEVRRVHGAIGPARFEAKGAADLEPLPKLHDVTVHLEGQGEELLALAGFELSAHPGLALKGAVRATATIEGRWSAPRFKGVLELERAALTVAPVIDKREGVPSAVAFEGRLSGGERLTLSRLDVRLPFVRLEGRGTVGLTPPHQFKVHLAAGPVSVVRLESGFSAGPLKAGVLKVSLDAKGQWSDWAKSRLYGWIELKQGVIQDARMKDAVKDVQVRAQLAGRDINIERISFKLRKSDVMIKGFVKRVLDSPDIVLTVESSKLDLWQMLSQQNMAQGQGAEAAEPPLDRLQRWTHTGHADIGLLISEARYRQLVFTKLSARLRMGEGRIEIDRVSGDTTEGVIKGETMMDFTVPSQIVVTGGFLIDGVPVERVVSLFEPNEEIVQGLLVLEGRLQGTWQEGSPFLGTLQSLDPITITIQDGRILRGKIMPKVLKILNVSALLKGQVNLDRDGVPFDSIAATVAIKDGVLTSEDIRFDSPIVKASGAGTHNLVADELGLSVAVSPLGTYSETMSKIPLFGQFWAGDHPGLTTALFEVTGSLNDPTVRYLPGESLAKGLAGYPRRAVDVLGNMVTLPRKAVSQVESR